MEINFPVHKFFLIAVVLTLISCAAPVEYNKMSIHYNGYYTYDEEGKKEAYGKSGTILIDEHTIHLDSGAVYTFREKRCFRKKCMWNDRRLIYILYWPHWQRKFMIRDKYFFMENRMRDKQGLKVSRKTDWLVFLVTHVEYEN